MTINLDVTINLCTMIIFAMTINLGMPIYFVVTNKARYDNKEVACSLFFGIL